MKRYIRIAAIIIGGALIVSITSCASITMVSHDNGRHEGWYKNPNNPHNPATTKEVKPAVKNVKSGKQK